MDNPKPMQVISHLQAKLLLVELLSSGFHASDNWRIGSPKVMFLWMMVAQMTCWFGWSSTKFVLLRAWLVNQFRCMFINEDLVILQ